MTVDAIMTRRHVSVSMDDSLRTIHNIFAAEHFHHLLVLENDHTLVGIISDRDLLKALSHNIGNDTTCARGLATLNKKAHQIMSAHPVVLHSGAPLTQAVDLLVENDLSCLPVVNTWGAAIGIVSWKDLLRHLHLLKSPTIESTPA